MLGVPSSLWVVWCLLLTSAGACAAQTGGPAPALPQGVERITSVEGITEYRLANGMRVLLFPDTSKPTTTVSITYLVGSRHENHGETGMAHLLEHLLLKASAAHPAMREELTAHGARGDGSTTMDCTRYFETFHAGDANLEWALDLEADRMVNGVFSQKELQTEIAIIHNEAETCEDNLYRLLLERVMASAYLWHSYGRPTIGAASDLENATLERVQQFYRTRYRPDNAVLLVAGHLDEAKTLSVVARKFGPIPRPQGVLVEPHTVEPAQDGFRMVTFQRDRLKDFGVAVCHIPSGSHPDAAPLDVLVRIIDGGPSGRLHRALIKTGKAVYVYAYAMKTKDPGVIVMGHTCKDAGGTSFDDTGGMLDVASTPPATAAEVERARRQLLHEIKRSLESPEQFAGSLSDWIAMGDWRLFFLHRDRVRKATVADVRRVATSYLQFTNCTLGISAPVEGQARVTIPSTPDVAGMLKGYQGDPAVAAGEAFDPSPANIDARTVMRRSGGVKMALLSKKSRGAAVALRLRLNFGDAKTLKGRSMDATLAALMLQRGTKKHTRQQISDILDRLGASLEIVNGIDSVYIKLDTTRGNLAAAVRLVAEMLREPSFPPDEFAQLKREQVALFDGYAGSNDRAALDALWAHLRPSPRSDARHLLTLAERSTDARAAILARVKEYHREFYGASNAEVAVVGDFDAEATARLLGDLFGRWKSPHPHRRLVRDCPEVGPLHRVVRLSGEANATFAAAQNIPISEDDPNYPALALANCLLGGTPYSRLFRRLREKEGISYQVWSRMSASSRNRLGSFALTASFAPRHAERIEAAFRDEIERALRDGFTPEEVETARAGYLKERQASRAQDDDVAGTWAELLGLNRTFASEADFEKKIQALTPEEILAALRKYLDVAKMSIVMAGDLPETAPAGGGGAKGSGEPGR